MSVGLRIGSIVDRDYFDIAAVSQKPATHEVTSDPPKTIDCNSNHSVLPSGVVN
jgi:hypothetical protein